MIDLGTFKRGDTFSFYVEMSNGDTPMTGIAENLRSQVRRDYKKSLLSELTITETETPGTYLFRHDGDTQSWPIGGVLIDIEYKDNDIVTSSDTYVIQVVEDVTYD